MADSGEGAAGFAGGGLPGAGNGHAQAASGGPEQGASGAGNGDAQGPPGGDGPRRPALVTWLCLGVITLAGVQFAGALGAARLPELGLTVPSGYLIVRNGLWGVWGVAAAAGAFNGHRWARGWLRWGALGMAGWYWLDQFFLAQSTYSRLGAPLRAIGGLVVLAVVWWGLDRPAVRRFFKENHG